MKKFIIALIILFPVLCFAERTITLPYNQTNFASPTDDDLIWGQGGGSTTSFTSTGCWSGSCVIATPPTDCEQGGSFGLGTFTLSESVPQLNLRFLMKIGSTYYSTASSCAGEGLGNKLVDTLQVGEAGRSIAGLLTDSHVPPTTSPYPFGLCTSGPSGTDYNCDNGGGGIDPCNYWYPSGRHTTTGCGYDRLHFGKDITTDYDNQWVSVEIEYVRNGYNKIYIYTLDGELAGLYVTNDALSNNINWSTVRHIGGYSNQDHPTADANTYIMFDEISMATSYIGPPAGFLDADETAPTLAEVTHVTTPSTNTTATYVFSSDEAGSITYGGTCGNGTLSTAINGNNTTYWTLNAGTYSNCTITVTDASSNASTPLAVTEFVITSTASLRAASGGVSFGGSLP